MNCILFRITANVQSPETQSYQVSYPVTRTC